MVTPVAPHIVVIGNISFSISKAIEKRKQLRTKNIQRSNRIETVRRDRHSAVHIKHFRRNTSASDSPLASIQLKTMRIYPSSALRPANTMECTITGSEFCTCLFCQALPRSFDTVVWEAVFVGLTNTVLYKVLLHTGTTMFYIEMTWRVFLPHPCSEIKIDWTRDLDNCILKFASTCLEYSAYDAYAQRVYSLLHLLHCLAISSAASSYMHYLHI